MTSGDLVAFLRRYRHAVQASVTPRGAPQAALVGVAVTDALELVFDTPGSTRKAANLRGIRFAASRIAKMRPGDMYMTLIQKS